MPQSLNLTDYIKVYKALTPELCQKILKVTETTTWRPHYWHNAYGGVNLNDKRKRKELADTTERFTQGIEVCNLDVMLESSVMHELSRAMSLYSYNVSPKLDNKPVRLISGFNSVRVNRYHEGVSMAKHNDHSFDKEHPLMTVIVLLNDEFEGGELILLDDYEVKLKVGEACYFPSNFMFPHEVKPVTKGTRYTLATWAW
jgi:hypothetical protein